MKKYIYLLVIILLLGCHNNRLKLERIIYSENIELDTIQTYNDYIFVNIIKYHFLGDFSMDKGILFRNNDIVLLYKFNINKKKYIINSSSKYITISSNSNPKINYGWFEIKDGHLLENVTRIDKIKNTTCLGINTISKSYNGYIYCYKFGRLVNLFNYGNLFIDSSIDFNNYNIGLYKVNNNKLIKLSNDPSIFKDVNIDGIYYIPPPGFNFINKYKIIDILEHTKFKQKKYINIKPSF